MFGQHSLASKTSVGLKVLFGLCLCFLLFGAYYLSKTFGCILFSFPVEESPAFIFPVSYTHLALLSTPFPPFFSTFFNFFSKRASSKQKAHRAKHGGLGLCGHF